MELHRADHQLSDPFKQVVGLPRPVLLNLHLTVHTIFWGFPAVVRAQCCLLDISNRRSVGATVYDSKINVASLDWWRIQGFNDVLLLYSAL
jgi:hypothetical protein